MLATGAPKWPISGLHADERALKGTGTWLPLSVRGFASHPKWRKIVFRPRSVHSMRYRTATQRQLHGLIQCPHHRTCASIKRNQAQIQSIRFLSGVWCMARITGCKRSIANRPLVPTGKVALATTLGKPTVLEFSCEVLS